MPAPKTPHTHTHTHTHTLSLSLSLSRSLFLWRRVSAFAARHLEVFTYKKNVKKLIFKELKCKMKNL